MTERLYKLMEHKEKYATECSYTMKLSMVRITWKKRKCNEVILTFKVSFKSCMMTTQTDRERMMRYGWTVIPQVRPDVILDDVT